MSIIKFKETIRINKNLESLFDYTQDYNNRLTWDTFLKKADLMEGAMQAGKGVKACCVAKNGLAMETEYITFNRPHVTAIKMTRGPFMFSSFLGSWTFKERGSNNTEVIFLYSFDLRFPFTLMSFFIKRNLQRNVRHRLIDLNTSTQPPSLSSGTLRLSHSE